MTLALILAPGFASAQTAQKPEAAKGSQKYQIAEQWCCGVSNKGEAMFILLRLSRAIDWVNKQIAVIANWLVLLACLISAGRSRWVAARVDRADEAGDSDAWLAVQRGSHGHGLRAEGVHPGSGRHEQRREPLLVRW